MSWGGDGRATAADDAGPDAFARYNFGWELADLLALARRFKPQLIVSYDRGGGYGHPDHVQCRQIAEAAAASLDIPLAEIVPDDAPPEAGGASARANDGELVEIPIDLGVKRRALAAHASQLTLTETGYRLSGGQEHELLPVERFRFLPFSHHRATRIP